MCRISAVILIFVCLTSLCAQGQISGIVLDKKTNSPIEYATIILKQSGKILEGTISNPDGSFLLPISVNGNFNIEIPSWLSEIRNRKRQCQKKYSP